ncbi:hypothetical protein U3516DRAFT_751192 [Neocallimastix sp. 'constans']
MIQMFNYEISDDFFPLQINITEGHITVDKNEDDGIKHYLYNLISNENTIYENAKSEMYQYSNIYGYPFKLNTINYNKDKSIYHMKISQVIIDLITGRTFGNFIVHHADDDKWYKAKTNEMIRN